MVASGHISESVTDQIEELQRIGRTGVDALILISNRLAPQHADPQVFLSRLKTFMSVLDPEIPLGFYECPSPYKRLLSMDELKFCADSGRFYFMKDTCCDLGADPAAVWTSSRALPCGCLTPIQPPCWIPCVPAPGGC